MRKERKFYSQKDKQTILKYVQRFDPPKMEGNNLPPFKPSTEQYTKDMAIMLDHIFSYEFKTQKLEEPTEQDNISGEKME